MLRGTSRFGAELDSLSDAISFGVAPALILYLWSLTDAPRFGWICALVFAVFCALRLARFNAQIDATEQPRKAAGYLTGIPAPAGAISAMLPLYLWFITGEPWLRSPWLVAPWMAFIAFLMISSIATFSWGALRLRRHIRFEALAVIVVIGAALVSAPWHTLVGLCLVYIALIPFSATNYARIRRQRANMSAVPKPSVPLP
jgi:CDP-diacylglycerol--serine O-phosphatidyltransferase